MMGLPPRDMASDSLRPVSAECMAASSGAGPDRLTPCLSLNRRLDSTKRGFAALLPVCGADGVRGKASGSRGLWWWVGGFGDGPDFPSLTRTCWSPLASPASSYWALVCFSLSSCAHPWGHDPKGGHECDSWGSHNFLSPLVVKSHSWTHGSCCCRELQGACVCEGERELACA